MRNIYSFINLTGLIAGLSAFTLIYLWVIDELSYDRFHSNYKTIFRVVENQFDEKGEVFPFCLTPGPLSPYLKNSFQEVEYTSRVAQVDFLVRVNDLAFYQEGVAVDPEFFEFFSFPIHSGETKSFAVGTDKIIISEQMATTFFGNSEPLGKTLKIVDRDFIVTAVMKNVPSRSHLQFTFAIPFDFLEAAGFEDPTVWGRNNIHTYVCLNKDDSHDLFAQKIKDAIKTNRPESTIDLLLQPLSEIHLESGHLNNDMAGRGNIQYVTIFSVIGIFILVIASINYANLATARSLKRAKEAGVRKVIGANKFQLMLHFFAESFLYSFLALLFALCIVWLMLPYFNELAGKILSLQIVEPALLFSLLGSVFFCSFIGGVYPAVVLSSLNPATVLKGLVKSGRGAVVLRRAIVIIQFTLCICFLIGTLIIKNQLTFIQSRKLGYNKEHVLTFSTNRKLRQQWLPFKNELKNIGRVSNVTASNNNLSDVRPLSWDVTWEGKDAEKEILFHQLIVDPDFINTYSIEIAEGRDFLLQNVSDSTGVLLNEQAARVMKMDDPINKPISIDGKKYFILGIVKDFHFESVHKPIEPILMYIDPEQFYEVSVRLTQDNLIKQVQEIETVFKKFNPGRPFEYTFLDDDLDKLYRNEKRLGEIFGYFSTLSVFISLLGLLGLVMYVTEQRAKEIAIRKIMGASTLHLIWLLSLEFIALVIFAFALASPTMYYAADLWLQNFAYKLEPGVWPYLTAGLGCIAIALITVCTKSFAVSQSNPIEPLRAD
jgi:ABC-type antimicrobial peptide transport system permease subunit